MGDLYFDRRASVTVGGPAVGPFVGSPIAGQRFRVDSSERDALGKFAEGLLVSFGFRITFEVVKTDTREPNTAKVEIYNLSQPTANKINVRDNVMILEAGYGDVVEKIYVGDITKATTRRAGVNRISTIECGTAAKACREKKLAESFAPGTSLKDIFFKAVKAFGLPLGDVEGLSDDELVNGFSSTGRIADMLDKIVGKSGASWSVQDGALTVMPKRGPKLLSAPLLSPDNGLLDSPETTETGIKFRALLTPMIAPSRFVEIQSAAVNGVFRVTKVTHRGDTNGGGSAFITEAEAVFV